jgi:hypothetical protein
MSKTTDKVKNDKKTRRTLPDGRVQEKKRAGKGFKWVTVSGHLPGEQRIVGADDPNSGGTHMDPRRGGRRSVRPGYDRKQDPIGYAYYSVYNRAPTEAERNSWGEQNKKGRWKSSSDVGTIMRHLSVTPEARRSRIDPSRYGVKDVDPNRLTGGDKAFYDSWRRVNPKAPFRNTELQYLRWARSAGNLQAFEAKNRGLIYDTASTKTYEDGSPITIRVVTPQAVRWAGENQIWVSGTKPNQIYYGALDGIKMANQQRVGEIDENTGFATSVSKGSPRRGRIRGEVGEFFTDVVSDQLKFAADPLGIVTPTLFGQEYGEALQRGGAQMTGADLEDIQTVQGVGQEIAATAAAFIPGIGLPLSAAIRAATAASRATVYGTSMSDAFAKAGKGFILDAFSVGIAQGFSAANKANAAYQSAYQSAKATGASAAQATRAGNLAISGVTRLTQGAITGAARGALSGAVFVGEGESISRSIGEGALVGGIAGAATPTIRGAFSGAAEFASGYIPGFSAESGLFRGVVAGATRAVTAYGEAELKYALDESYRAEVNAAIERGDVKDKGEYFEESAIGDAAAAAYGGFRDAAQSFGETLGEIFEKPEGGYFSDFGWKEPTPEKIPSFQQVMFGEDEKFQLNDIFGGGDGDYQGLVEAFVEASLVTLGGSFATGALNRREGPVTPGLGGGGGYPQFTGGPTYGGFGSPPTDGVGPDPLGSVITEIVNTYGGIGRSIYGQSTADGNVTAADAAQAVAAVSSSPDELVAI